LGQSANKQNRQTWRWLSFSLSTLSVRVCALSPATAPHNISRNNKMRKVKLANPLPCPYKGKLPSFRGLIFSAGVSMMESAPEKNDRTQRQMTISGPKLFALLARESTIALQNRLF
jgi:hypothetical protein